MKKETNNSGKRKKLAVTRSNYPTTYSGGLSKTQGEDQKYGKNS